MFINFLEWTLHAHENTKKCPDKKTLVCLDCLDCPNGPKLQMCFMNLEVDISLYYLSWPSAVLKRREIRFSHPRLHIRDGYVCKELRSIHLWFRKQELINQKLLSLLPKMYALFFKTNNGGSFLLLNITDLQQSNSHTHSSFVLSLTLLLISNPTNRLRLHQFLGTKTTEANKSLKTILVPKL